VGKNTGDNERLQTHTNSFDLPTGSRASESYTLDSKDGEAIKQLKENTSPPNGVLSPSARQDQRNRRGQNTRNDHGIAARRRNRFSSTSIAASEGRNPKSLASKIPTDTAKKQGLFLMMMIKFADISNPCKPSDLYHGWSGRINEEFLQQGDRERELGRPISKFMDRKKGTSSECQVGFMTYIVKPLLDKFTKVAPGLSLLKNFNQALEQHLNHHQQIVDHTTTDDPPLSVDSDAPLETKHNQLLSLPAATSGRRTLKKLVIPKSSVSLNFADMSSSPLSRKPGKHFGREDRLSSIH
jgi:hypothetical protein